MTCLSVHANVALLNVPGPFGLVAFRITDGASTGVADLIETGSATGGPTECSLPAPLYTDEDRVVSGDLTVHNASAVPTSKEQCKNDGWRQFGSMFKNQGQCVAYVERGPKNQPIL